MDKKHLICRKGAAISMAQPASSAEARLIQPAPVRRYRVGAAANLPFMLPRKGPTSLGERAVLHLPACSLPPPRGKPGRPAGDGR